MQFEEILKELYRRKGKMETLRHLQEECGEVVAAINHFSRGRISMIDVLSEIADLLMLVDQLSTDEAAYSILKGIYNDKIIKLQNEMRRDDKLEEVHGMPTYLCERSKDAISARKGSAGQREIDRVWINVDDKTSY